MSHHVSSKKQIGSGLQTVMLYQNMDKMAIDVPSREIENFYQRHHIRRLSFFGSVVRDDFGPYSDVDVLVEFESGHIPGFDFFLMEAELSQLLVRKVDLQTVNFLSPEILHTALQEAVTAYEQASLPKAIEA